MCFLQDLFVVFPQGFSVDQREEHETRLLGNKLQLGLSGDFERSPVADQPNTATFLQAVAPRPRLALAIPSEEPGRRRTLGF